MPYANRNDSRWSHKRLRCEPLEHRLMLNADPLGSDVLLRDSSDAVLFAEVTGASYEEFTTSEQDSTALDRFASAEELQQYLIEDALERYSGLFGQPGHYWRYWPTYLDGGMVFTTGQAETDPDHSDTNTQVAGVDEGDIVETDGNYLYVLSGQELVIIKAWSGGEPELEIASRVTIDGQPFAEYLNGDRLTVLSREFNYYPMIEPVFAPQIWPPYYPPSPYLTVSVFDVSNRKNPTEVQKTDLDGSLVDSRAIGNFVYLVLRDDFTLPPPKLLPVSEEVSGGDGSKQYPDDTALVADTSLAVDIWYPPPEGEYVYETKEEYFGRIDGQVVELALPHFSSYGPEGELVASGLLSEATDVYKPLCPDPESLMSVVVFDMASNVPGPVSSTSVPSDYTSEVYVSLDSLYLLQSGWTSIGTGTSILKFRLDGADVNLSAMGAVPGHVLNQFSVDQHEGYLRIATTGGGWRDSRNNVYVLKQDGRALRTVGRLEGLAPGEQIYSARFMEDTAFLVTFRMVDPLFVIDLSDPTCPELTGRLKITGFSNYLHYVDGSYLIGIGRYADPNTGLYQDPQVSLFYVGGVGNPVLLDQFTMKTGRTGGLGIFDDHHVIAYFPEHHVLTISVPDRDYNDQISRYCYRNDLWVFKINVGTIVDTDGGRGGIERLGRIEHKASVRRSVRIEDYLYSISDNMVTVHDIFNPKIPVARLIYGAEKLGTVDFLRLNDLDLSAGEHWYQFQTGHQGLLRVDATGSEPVELGLYNSSGELLESPAGEPAEWHVGAGESYSFSVRATTGDDGLLPDDSATVTLSVVPSEARIVGQHLFYNNSTFDGNNPDANTGDDGAIAPDKKALLPGEQATFANYTSFSCGITGMMVDVGNPGDTITLDDFRFRVGNDNDLGTWVEAPAPRTFTVRQHAGTTGSHRVTMAWDDHAIENRWLQVTALAANLGLPEDYVFYFGSAVAESGNSSSDAQVTTADLLLAHKNPRDASNPAGIESRFDYNRDQRVNRTDVLLARNNQTNFLNALKLISPPGAASEGLGAEIDKVSAYDAVLAEAAGGESQSRETSPPEMQWLSELDGTSTLSQPSENQKIAAKTVDELLATLLV